MPLTGKGNPIDTRELARRFTHHPPIMTSIARLHGTARQTCLTAANQLNEILPEGREKSLALTKLEEVMMWANAAIARQQEIIIASAQGVEVPTGEAVNE